MLDLHPNTTYLFSSSFPQKVSMSFTKEAIFISPCYIRFLESKWQVLELKGWEAQSLGIVR